MYQEPTELLWIGCLTGLILTLKFRFDTLIGNFTRHESNNLLHLFNISISASMRKEDSSERMDSQYTRIDPVLDMKVCRHEDRCSIEVLVESLFQDHNSLLGSNRERTCCQSKTTTEAHSDAVFRFYSCS